MCLHRFAAALQKQLSAERSLRLLPAACQLLCNVSAAEQVKQKRLASILRKASSLLPAKPASAVPFSVLLNTAARALSVVVLLQTTLTPSRPTWR